MDKRGTPIRKELEIDLQSRGRLERTYTRLTTHLTGRKEITTFFYSYFLLTICSLLLDCGVIPIGGSAYPYFTAIQSGLTSATCICLMINGFVGFQLYEDGTTLSVWLLRVCSGTMFIITFAVSLLTFKGWAGLGPTNTVGLFVVLYIFSAIFIFVFVFMQVLLVLGTLQDRWPLGNIAFGIFFFVVGQIILYVFSEPVCEGISHYMDGLFFATVCNLLGVMMVYKVSILSQSHQTTAVTNNNPQFWDSITREDLEFSVGTKQNNWDIKDPNLYDDPRHTVYQDDSEYASSMYHQPPHRSSVHGSSHGY